jgi:hypothetical protein
MLAYQDTKVFNLQLMLLLFFYLDAVDRFMFLFPTFSADAYVKPDCSSSADVHIKHPAVFPITCANT